MNDTRHHLRNHTFFSLFSLSIILALIAGACQPATPQTTAASGTPPPAETKASTGVSSTTEAGTPSPATQPTVTFTPVPYLQVDPKKLQGVKIVLWHPWVDEMDLKMKELVTQFNQSNEWGINVDVVTLGSSSQLFAQVEEGVKNQKLPQVIITPVENLAYWQATQKIVVNLNDYVQHPKWGFSTKETADFSKVFWDQDEIDGYRLGVPAQRNMQAMFYNLTWAKEMGFSEPPTSIDDFKSQACGAAQANLGVDISATTQANSTLVAKAEASATLDATAAANATADAATGEETNPQVIKATPTLEKTATGGMIFESSPLSILSWLMAFGGGQTPLDEKQPYKFNTGSNEEAFVFLRHLYDSGCIWMSRLPQPYEYFANRQALFYSGSIQDVDFQAKTQSRLNSNDEWTTLMFPSKDDKPTVIVSGPSYAILKSTPEEQLASWLFIRWLSTPENQAQIAQTSSSIPVGVAAIALLEDYGQKHPQWLKATQWVPMAKPAPRLASWRIVRNVVQDATWYIFQNVRIDQIPSQLEQMDQMIPEVIKQN